MDKSQEYTHLTLELAVGDSFTIVGRHQIAVCQVLSVRGRTCCEDCDSEPLAPEVPEADMACVTVTTKEVLNRG